MKDNNKLKKEILKAVEKAIDGFELVDLGEKEERIRVPENIKFEEIYGRLCLNSPNGKLTLSAIDKYGGIPDMAYAGEGEDPNASLYTDPLYLEPCKREDLKCGDIAFRAGYIHPDFKEHWRYGVILNNEEHAFWRHGLTMAVSHDNYSYWYKVVK